MVGIDTGGEGGGIDRGGEGGGIDRRGEVSTGAGGLWSMSVV